MDKKLLDALNNLSEALDLIAQALSEKDSAQSPTAKALEAGNFVNQIKEINKGIKKLQADNQKIIKNQETILALSKKKENEKKTEVFRTAGDKDMQKLIKTGVSVVLVIAAGVLAIGMAFKLIGKVDFLSVVGLSLAIVMVSIAFEKVAKLKLSPKNAATTSLVMVMMAGAITASSWILKMVMPISPAQGLTALLISSVLAIASYSLEKTSIGVLRFKKTGINTVDLVLVLVGISTAIAASSWILKMVMPISLAQGLTAIFVSSTLAIISLSLEKISIGVLRFKKKGINAADLLLVLVGISAAITASSWVLSLVIPISFSQIITTLSIAVIFAAIGYIMPYMAIGISIIHKTIGASKMWIVPLVFIAISTAITASSFILSKTTPIPFTTLLNILAMSVVLSVSAVLLGMTSYILSQIKTDNIIEGGLSIIVIATTIMVSSLILNIGTYENYPDFNWALGVGLSIIAFSMPIVILGLIAMSGAGALTILVGGAMVLLVAATIVRTSYILAAGNYSKYPDFNWSFGVGLSIIAFSTSIFVLGLVAMTGIGTLVILSGGAMVLLIASTIAGTSYILAAGNYSKYPTPDWSMGTGLSLLAFGMSMVVLGSFILGTLGLGYLALEAGSKAVLTISETIVEAASILNKGNFKGGPTKEWAEGISLALGAFAPIYAILMSKSIMSSLFGGGVSVDDFKSAIETISEGIVTSAEILGKSPGIWKDGPSEEWAKGVSTALGAFAPIYSMLMAKSIMGVFGGGVSVDDFKSAIKTISEGIVDVANFFGENIASFDLSKVPSKEWSESVSSSIQAFMPALNFISDNDGMFSSGTDKLINGIMAVAKGIVLSSRILSLGKFTKAIPPDWVDSISGNIKAYVNLSKYITDNYKSSTDGIVGKIGGILFGSNNQMDSVISGLTKLGIAYDSLSESIKNFGNSINEIDAEKLSMIKAFTSNVVLMSLMDPDAFEEMLDKLEEKAGIFANIISDMNSATEQGNKSITSVKAFTTNTPETEQTQQKILQILSNMDAKLGTIARNSSTLADYTNELRTGQGVKIKK